MQGFLKKLEGRAAVGAFETVRTGEVSLTPNKWCTMAEIRGKGKLLQADVFGQVPYNGVQALNVGEATWDMRILIDGETFADVRMKGVIGYGGIGHLLATDFTYLLPCLDGSNSNTQNDLLGNGQTGNKGYVNILAERDTEGKPSINSRYTRVTGYMNVLPFIGSLPFQSSLEIQMAFLFTNPSDTLPEERQCLGSVDIAYQLDER